MVQCSSAWAGEVLTSSCLPTPHLLSVIRTDSVWYNLYWGNLRLIRLGKHKVFHLIVLLLDLQSVFLTKFRI